MRRRALNPVSRSLIQALIFSFVLAIAAGPARAGEPPLSKDSVTLLLLGGATPDKMVQLVEQRGIDFELTPELAKKFRDYGADDRVMAALEKASARFKSGVPAPAANPSKPPAETPGAGPSAPAAASETVEQKIAAAIPSSGATDESAERPLAPTFSVVDLTGNTVDLADYRGSVVLLDFWATWCGPCRAEIPKFMALQERYRDQGFQAIGISLDTHRSEAKKFFREYNMNYPVAMVTEEIRKQYGGLHAVPTTLLIGPDGRVFAKVVGKPADMTSFEQAVKMLLAQARKEQAPSAPVRIATAQTVSGQAAQAKTSATPAGPAPSPAAPSPAAAVASADSPPPAPAPAAAKTPPGLTDPSPDQIEQIVREFSTKEKLFKEARNNYTYHQINKVQTLDPDGNVSGTFQQEWDILYDDNGKRIENVTYAPPDTLKSIIVTKEDYDRWRNIQPFVLTVDELPDYEVKYLGHVRLDEVTAYVFSIRPKEIKKGRQYFQGVIWVDDRDLQIVKTEGKTVPEVHTKEGQNVFPRFTTYREQIDGKFWFPTYTTSDDMLYFPGAMPVHIREVIRYSDYKQFKAASKIRVISEEPVDKTKPPEKQKP